MKPATCVMSYLLLIIKVDEGKKIQVDRKRGQSEKERERERKR